MSRLTKAQEAEIIEVLKSMMKENQKHWDDLHKKLDESNKRLEGMINDRARWREELKDNSKPETREIPKDENTEQVNPKTEEDRGIKNQITKKTEEKKMKIRGMIRPKKVRLTQELLEMTRGGLINFINHPIIDHRTMTDGKKYEEKNLIKAFEVNHHVTRKRNSIKRVVKVNTPRKKILLNRSRTSSIVEMTGTPVRSKPNDGTIDSTCYTIRRATKEELQCQPTDQELTEKGLDPTITTDLQLKETLTTTKWKDKMMVRYIPNIGNHLNIKMIQTTNAPKMSDHG